MTTNLYNISETLLADEAICRTDWFLEASSNVSVFWRTQSHTDARGNTYWELTLFRRIPLAKTGSFAVLSVTVSDNYLRSRIHNNTLNAVLSVNREPVFYSDERSLTGNSLPVFIDYNAAYYSDSGILELNGEKTVAAVSTLLPINSDDRLYIISYYPDAVHAIESLYRCYLLVICAIILIPCVLFFIYSRYFSARVLMLRKAMYQASRGSYDIADPLTGNDELSETFQDLRTMVERIKQNEAQIYQARIHEQEIENRQQQMEFEMLASQINPHFLYNTL